MKPFFYLRYLNILAVVGLFIKEGISCEVVPTDKEHARIHFESDDIGNMAKQRLPFLKSVPIRRE